MLGIGTGELILILAILLLIFGATRLPKLARSIGQSAGELKRGFEDTPDTKKKSSQNKDNA
jgi:sec-independent protein translocase protein TatA